MKGAANEVDGWILEERSSLLVFLRGTERMDIMRCIQWEWNGIGMGWDIYTLHIEMEYGVFGESGRKSHNMDFISTVYSPIHLLDMLLRVVHPIPPSSQRRTFHLHKRLKWQF
jgi:hypothetical protein